MQSAEIGDANDVDYFVTYELDAIIMQETLTALPESLPSTACQD